MADGRTVAYGDGMTMGLTKKHVVYLGILGVVGLGFAVDRLFLASGPSPATAATGETGPAAAPVVSASPPAEAKAAVPVPERLGLPERLAALAKVHGADPAHAQDAFLPREPWLSELRKPAAPTEPQVNPSEEFARQHKLTSVLVAADGGSAVVDGKAVRIGQELDGFRLVRVAPGRAVFQSDADPAVEAQLEIPANSP